MQCEGITTSGSKCTRKATANNCCWQHGKKLNVITTQQKPQVLETKSQPTPNINSSVPSVYQLAQNPPDNWGPIFKDSDAILKQISDSLDVYEAKTHTLSFPERENIFNAFKLTPLNDVKVLIVGQDSYHSVEPNGKPTAQGLAFSVPKNAKIPSSLRNIYKELDLEYQDFKMPTNGNLEGWAKQGVLLLNTSLTVEPHKAKSHGTLWFPFIEKVITDLAKVKPNVVMVLWGAEAQKFQKFAGPDWIIYKSSHPSGLSATKGNNPFIGSDVFLHINTTLTKLDETPINWAQNN
jgi:uracil-DNA glycosylase